MEPSLGNSHTTVDALSIRASLNALQGLVHQPEFGGFTLVNCELQITRGVHLRGGVFWSRKMAG